MDLYKMLAAFFMVCVLASIIGSFRDRSKTEKRAVKTGAKGEQKLVELLRGESGAVLQNLYMPTRNGQTTEVDLVYISKKGVFAIESKNYHGTIRGAAKQRDWFVAYKNGARYKMYNPIMQNQKHCDALRCATRKFMPKIYNLVVFGSGANIEAVSHLDGVICAKDLAEYVESNSRKDVFTEEQVTDIYFMLKTYTVVTNDTKKKHIANAKKARRR